MLTGHGDDRHTYPFPIRADFSSNVVPGPISAKLLEHLQLALPQLNHYPEPDAASLATALSEHHQLSADQILVTNGSVEAFYLLAQLFTGTTSHIYCPSFAEYEDACRVFQHKTVFSSIADFGLTTPESSTLSWLGNPNNPDGNVTSVKLIEDWLNVHPTNFLIVDEAYANLCAGFESAIPLLNRFPNLIIVRSFTKTYAIPGIRLGYVLASAKLIASLKKIKMPWSVNQLATEAGKFILQNNTALLPDLSTLSAMSKKLQNDIPQLPGLTVIPSPTNYFLVETKYGSNSELKSFLLEKHRILVRDAANFRLLKPNAIRISVQNEEENQLLIDALREWTLCF